MQLSECPRWARVLPALWIALVAWYGPGTVHAATISYAPSASEINCNDLISIDVVVDQIADLRGFTLEVEYDSTLLSLVSVDPGVDLIGAPCPYFFHPFPITTTMSAVQLDGATLGCSLAGPAVIATLTFVGSQDGIAIIDCRSVDLRNSLNLMVAATCSNGIIQISCPVPTAASTWTTLKSRYR